MAIDVTTLTLAKSYVKQTLRGMGALKGSPATVKSTKTVENGLEVTFGWTDATGKAYETKGVVPKGEKGERGLTGTTSIATVTVEVEPTDTITLVPNVFYVIDGEVEDLTIEFAEGTEGIASEYMWQMNGHSDLILSVPDDVMWMDEFEAEEGKVYQFSCLNDLLVYVGM